jgi:hypothetical protein
MSKWKEKTWEEREAEREKRERTYFNVDKFVKDFRDNSLKEHFILSDGFTELTGTMEADPALAREISDAGVILLMKADAGFEIDGVIEMAQVIAEENGG